MSALALQEQINRLVDEVKEARKLEDWLYERNCVFKAALERIGKGNLHWNEARDVALEALASQSKSGDEK